MGAMIHFLALLPTKSRQATERVGFCQHFPLCFRASEVGLCGRLIAEQPRRGQLPCHPWPPIHFFPIAGRSNPSQVVPLRARPRGDPPITLQRVQWVDRAPRETKNQLDDGENGRRDRRSVSDAIELSRDMDTARLARRNATVRADRAGVRAPHFSLSTSTRHPSIRWKRSPRRGAARSRGSSRRFPAATFRG
jgi:hypothetical protein